MDINTSPEFNLIAKALHAFQCESEDIVKDKKGFGYNYADLAAVLSSAKQLWTKHDLAVVQFPMHSHKENHISLVTRLMHSSGQYMECKMEMEIERLINKQGKNSTTLAQAAGSVITYMRRYTLCAIFGIATVDDDGQQNIDVDYRENRQKWKNYNQQSKQSPINMVIVNRIEKLLAEQGKKDEFMEWIRKKGHTKIEQCSEAILKACLQKLEVSNYALEQDKHLMHQGENDENT